MSGARHFDHIVIAGYDIDSLAQFYARLGFRVGGRNVHPWGTQNHIVQFDGTFLELIGLPKDRAISEFAPYFARYLRDFLQENQGLAMLVLHSTDAQADHAAFAAAKFGLGEVFDFARNSRRPDGGEVQVAFSLAFARPPENMKCGFFTCQQHFPQNFWNPAFQIHENGVSKLRQIEFLSSNPVEDERFFRSFSAFQAQKKDRKLKIASETVTLASNGQSIVLTQAEQGRFDALVFALADLEAFRTMLRRNQVTFIDQPHRVIIAPENAFGARLIFEQV